MSRFPITMMRSPAPIMNDDIYIINSQDSILEEKNPIGHFDCFTCSTHVTLLNLLVHNWPTMYNHHHWKYLNQNLYFKKSVPFLFGSNLSLKSPKLYDSELGWPVISVRPLSPGLFESSSSERTPRFLFDSSFLRVLTLNLKFRVFLSNFAALKLNTSRPLEDGSWDGQDARQVRPEYSLMIGSLHKCRQSFRFVIARATFLMHRPRASSWLSALYIESFIYTIP